MRSWDIHRKTDDFIIANNTLTAQQALERVKPKLRGMERHEIGNCEKDSITIK